jgi:ABC-type transport system involved in cytochrome c biogenesis permease component
MNLAYLLLLLSISLFLFALFHPIYKLGFLFGLMWLPFALWLIGFCILGTVFSGMLLGYEKRDASLSLLLYPFMMPATIAWLKCFELSREGYLISVDINWVYFLALFDGIYLMLALYVQEELFE